MDGTEQIATSPMDLLDSVKEGYEESEFKTFGVMEGLFKGIFHTLIDAGGGMVNTLTFWYDIEGSGK